MAAGSIVIDLLMKTASLETDSRRAEKRLKEFQREVERMGVAVGAAFAAVGVASAAMVKHAIDSADEMGKMAQKVGTTVEELSALAYAASLTGPSQEQLGQAMVKLAKNMADAAQGTGEAGKAFTALGINVRNSDGTLKSSAAVLTEIAEKFTGFRDGAEKTALAVELFGRSGAELMPLLNQGADGIAELTSEARQFGVLLDGDLAKAAEDFNDNLTRMGAAVSGVATRAARELLPALGEVSSMLVDVAKHEATVSVAADIVKAAVGGLITVFQTVAVVGSDVGFVFLSVGREIGAWAAQLAALARGDWQGFRAISDAVKADGERARAELDKFQAKIMNIGQPAARDPRLLGDVPSIASQTAGWRSAAPQVPGGGGGGGKGRASRAEKPFATSDRFSAADALEAEVRMLNEAQEAWAKYSQQQQSITSDRYDAAFAMEEESRIIQEAQQAWADSMKKDAEETTRVVDQLGLSFASAAEDAFINFRDVGDVFKGLLQDVARLIFRLLVVEPILKRIKEAMSDNGGGGGFNLGKTLFSAVAGSFGGGLQASFAGTSLGSSGFGTGLAYGNQDIGGFLADGGPAAAGRPYVVGERGPELFVPRTAGMVIPNHALGSSGAPVIINQTTGRVDNVRREPMPDGSGREAWLLQELSNPNSKVGQTLQRRYNLRPAR